MKCPQCGKKLGESLLKSEHSTELTLMSLVSAGECVGMLMAKHSD